MRLGPQPATQAAVLRTRFVRSSSRGRAAVLAVCLLTPAVGAAQGPPAPVRLGVGGPPSPPVELSSPTRLAPGPLPGTLAVADSTRRVVLLVDSDGLSSRGEIALDSRPSAVASLAPWLYVGDEASGTVTAYNPAGKQVFDFEGTVGRPTDMAVSGEQRLVFVTDAAAAEVKVFSDRGSLLYSFGGAEQAGAKLIRPTGIAYDPDRREVLVSDFGKPESGISARVQIYSQLGEHRATLSEAGQDRAFRFSRPQGLAVADDRIYLVDSLLGQVLVFDRATLKGLEVLGSYGSGAGELLLPLDVVREPSSGRLFVTSNRTGRIEIFADEGAVP